MTFVEAMQALERGEKVRRTDWDAGNYISLSVDKKLVDSENKHWFLGSSTFSAEWEIYTEPKPKKQVWQWRTKEYDKDPWYVQEMLRTEAEAEEWFKGCWYAYEKHAGPFEVEE